MRPTPVGALDERVTLHKVPGLVRAAGYHLAAVVWWLIPLLGLSGVLLTSYQALTEQRSSYANSTLGVLLKGDRVGQSFVAQYDNLSGVAVAIGSFNAQAGPARATLVLHLRAAPTPGPDLATARLPAGQPIGVNPWYRFSFPPIAGSAGKPFYIEIESPDGVIEKGLTLFWWQDGGAGDPYPYGTAYRMGQPQDGDLAFSLYYNPSPGAIWEHISQRMAINFQPLVAALLGLVVLAGGLAVARLCWPGQAAAARRGRLRRWSLPLALGVALGHGLVYLAVTPPWQGPDEPAHFAYAALLDRSGLDATVLNRVPPAGTEQDTTLVATMNASLSRHAFMRRLSYASNPGAEVDVGQEMIFAELHQPITYYWLCAAVVHTARTLGWISDPYIQPEDALRLMRGVSLVLSLGVVGLAWLAGLLVSPGDRYTSLRVLLPFTIAALPMHAFMGTVVDNDILAELAASAVFVAFVALLRWSSGRRGAALAGLLLLLTLACVFTKTTAVLASVPLLGVGLLIYLGRSVSRGLARRGVESKVTILGLLALLLAVGASLLLAFEPQARTANWQVSKWPTDQIPGGPFQRLAQVRTPSAHAGATVIELGPTAPHDLTAEQVLVPPFYHPALAITVTAWARLAPEAAAPISPTTTARLILMESATRVGRTVVSVDPAGAWTLLTVTGTVSAGSSNVVVQLKAPEQPVQFDDLSAQVTAITGSWDNPIVTRRLRNPSFEDGSLELRPFVAGLLPLQARLITDILVEPQPFDKLALWRYYADQQNRSFWGNFGWLTLPLPEPLYQVIGGIMIVALSGLLAWGRRRRGAWSREAGIGFATLFAFSGTLFLEFASVMMLLVTRGNTLYPQGRYLFVLIIPICWLLLEGLRESWSLVVRVGEKPWEKAALRRAETSGATSAHLRPYWGSWVWLNGVFMFTAYCLLSLILPFYWG